ncbi:MAG: heavy-metal-associated domain-containing protein [Geminicoccaceae bacterium]|jgi:copper chaperone CopZ
MAGDIVRLRIEGMGCGSCVAAVTEALRQVHGVRRVSVELEAGSAEVEAAPPADAALLLAAVDRAGYDAALA